MSKSTCIAGHVVHACNPSRDPRPAQAKITRPCVKNFTKAKELGHAQVRWYLTNKSKVLGSIPITASKKKSMCVNNSGSWCFFLEYRFLRHLLC
jgi:hypothetical protein